MSKKVEGSKVQQRKVEQEEKPLKEVEEKLDQKDVEKSQASSMHIYKKPSIYGNKYNEFPVLSIFLHMTLFIMYAILYFMETDRKPMFVVMTFFYIGIQFESIYGDIPYLFKVKPVVRDISSILNKWQEKWIDITYESSAFHYQSRNVHGQKRRGKNYSSYKETKFNYLTCEDASEDCSQILKQNDIYVIQSEILFSYGNEKAEQDFNEKIKQSLEEAQKKDKFVDTNITIKFRDTEDIPLDVLYIQSKSIFINKFFFWVTSLLLLTVPYRLYVNSKTAHLEYKIHKRIYA